ncbi:uncharacterized protein [Pyrus communis]|uniref:uncharacterized protein n=1 Tax=Pyrus communis TaxID=23211 RepID=UPI0035C1C46B
MTHANLINNYFNPNSMYTKKDFRRHYRMRRLVFEHLLCDVQQVNLYFRQKRDRAGHPGFSPHHKVYKDEYLREPNQEDMNRLIRKAEDHGFPGMIRSQNDITVFGHSPLYNRLTGGKAPQLDYYINCHQYNMRYYLVDGIYPKWTTFAQIISNPRNDAEKLFTLHQEAYGKDVERAFGILQAQWKIISKLRRGWSRENLDYLMMSCIILHNMMVEDERDEYIDRESADDQEDPNRSRRAHAKIYDGPNLSFNPRTSNIFINEYMRRYRMMCSRATNKYLQQDLVAHLWAKRSME